MLTKNAAVLVRFSVNPGWCRSLLIMQKPLENVNLKRRGHFTRQAERIKYNNMSMDVV